MDYEYVIIGGYYLIYCADLSLLGYKVCLIEY